MFSCVLLSLATVDEGIPKLYRTLLLKKDRAVAFLPILGACMTERLLLLVKNKIVHQFVMRVISEHGLLQGPVSKLRLRMRRRGTSLGQFRQGLHSIIFRAELAFFLYIYIYMYMYICMCVYIYICSAHAHAMPWSLAKMTRFSRKM